MMQELGPRPRAVIADKGYDSDAIRDDLATRKSAVNNPSFTHIEV